MKKYFLLIVLLNSIVLVAQKPEPVYSFARVLKPMDWYKNQIVAWKNVIKKDSTNGSAWYNYYRATRCLVRCDTKDNRTWDEKIKDEEKVMEQMSKIIPNTYEYNLCMWLMHGNNYDYISYLKKAAELGEGRTEHISDMIIWGEIDRDLTKKNTYAKKWYESKDFSTGFLYYNYNVLVGLKPNAIIISTGDNDTYPIWLLQSQGIRRDVTLLNLSLLYIDKYRDKIFKELNIAPWDTAMHAKNAKPDQNPYHNDLIKQIAENKNKYPVYIALTVGDEYSKTIEDKLYLTGLAYEYNNETVDNIALLKGNFEQHFALDYLDKNFYDDVSAEKVKEINCNYIVPMLKLYDHYKTAGDRQKADWIKAKILVIAKDTEYEKKILEHINKN